MKFPPIWLSAGFIGRVSFDNKTHFLGNSFVAGIRTSQKKSTVWSAGLGYHLPYKDVFNSSFTEEFKVLGGVRFNNYNSFFDVGLQQTVGRGRPGGLGASLGYGFPIRIGDKRNAFNSPDGHFPWRVGTVFSLTFDEITSWVPRSLGFQVSVTVNIGR